MPRAKIAPDPRTGKGTSERLVRVPEAVRDTPSRRGYASVGLVPRDDLLARVQTSGADVIAIVAGAGYGKTTFLREMAERDPRPIAWLALDAADDDPAGLLADLATALNRIAPLDQGLLHRLTSSDPRMPTLRARELMRSFEGLGEPVLVVLDDVHHLTSPSALDIVASVVEHVPSGSSVALASRELPEISLPRLRASGRLLQFGDRDLAMGPVEAARLLRGLDLDLPEEAISLIVRRTEGWPVAIYLASRSIRGEKDPVEAASRFGGDDRLVADYVRDELLRAMPRVRLRFVRRTAILRRLTPGLCDAVTGSRRSAMVLADLERSNPLVEPVVREPDRYRYHQLFRDVLLSELRRIEPELVPELYLRAAAWSEANGEQEDAIYYAHAGGHVEEAARLVCSVYRSFMSTGRLQTVGRWLAWFDEDAMLAYPPLALATGWYHAIGGDADAVHWLRLAEAGAFDGPMPDGSASFDAGVALLRGALCLGGPAQMDADVELAAALGAPGSGWLALYRLFAGEAALLLGDTDRAKATFQEATELVGPNQPSAHVVLLSELAAIALEEGKWDEAGRWNDEARSLVASRGLAGAAAQPLTYAVSALVLARRGEPDLARKELVEAQKLRATSSHAIPSVSIRGRAMMARAYLALSDTDGARAVLREAREFQAHRPNIGTLADVLDELDAEIREARVSGMSGPTSLSAAELRVLVLLPTHLSFRQIGERLFVSSNTVKSHAMSIYHKLGVSSRSEAVERSAEFGLLDL
jgi:LuxR family maltose regulon positive regulatory protein